MQVPGQGDESGWRRDLLALQRRVGELERQVAELRGTSPKSAAPVAEASWPEPVAGQTLFAYCVTRFLGLSVLLRVSGTRESTAGKP